MINNIASARRLLDAANVFYDEDSQELNLNDVWGWACSCGEEVKDEELVEVAKLFWDYGWAGILYWASKKDNGRRSEFHDVNRCIDFVGGEEKIKSEVPNDSERAVKKVTYVIGERD